jgi:hypothetical protein
MSRCPLPTRIRPRAVRESGGVSARESIARRSKSTCARVDLPKPFAGVEARRQQSSRAAPSLSDRLALSRTMWDLAMEVLGKGDPVPYERCVEASTAKPPEPSRTPPPSANAWPSCWAAPVTPSECRRRVAGGRRCLAPERIVPMASVRALGAAVIAHFDNLSAKNLLPYLPPELARVPRANIDFLPIKDAWFSGSMNYLGRARNADGSPQYEATYEINASLQISYPEFEQLVSHEVVPGHVTTFAYLQNLYVRGKVGFEATVLTMNTRAATLFEGIANNAILIAHGVTEVDQLPDEDLQIGVLLALLQDDAKNQSSYLTWGEGVPQAEVAATLRAIFWSRRSAPISLSGAWGRHPLLGRMYLPAYRSGHGTRQRLRSRHRLRRFGT